jgi:chromate transport protein ChrA
VLSKYLKVKQRVMDMSSQPSPSSELLNYIRMARRGVLIMLYIIPVNILLLLIFITLVALTENPLLSLLYYLLDAIIVLFMVIYGAHLQQRGIRGIGWSYNNSTLIKDTGSLFWYWVIYAVIPLFGLIFLGFKMADIAEDLYNMFNIKEFNTAISRWEWSAYLAIVFGIGYIIAVFAMYNTYKGLDKALKSVTLQ